MKQPTLDEELVVLTQRTFSQKLIDRFFGYDFFISYRWEDGRTYAVKLASELKERGFDCFLDSESYAKGQNWKSVGALAIRRTSRLVLVGSPGVLESDPVLREVRIFSRSGRRLIPIDFGGTLSSRSLEGHSLGEFLTADVLQIKEDACRLGEGPSETALQELQKAFDCERQSARRLRALKAMTIGSLIIAVFALLVASISFQAKRTADRLATERQAELDRASDARLSEQQRQRDEAASAQLAAKVPGVLAEDRELATLLAVEAVKIARTREAEQALRKALLSPVSPLVLRGHSNDVFSARFSEDGKRVFTVSTDGTARLWDAVTGAPLRTFQPDANAKSYDSLVASLSRDGTKVVIMTGPSTLALGHWENRAPVRLYDAVTGKVLVSFFDEDAIEADISPDNSQIVTASFIPKPRIWNASTGKVQFELPGHENTVSSACFNSNGNWVVTASRDGTARVWEARTGRNLAVLRVGAQLEWAIFLPGDKILTLDAGEQFGDGKHLQLWDWQNTRVSSAAEFIGHQKAIREADCSGDGRRLATATYDEARVWDTASGRCLAVLGHSDDSSYSERGVGISPNGEWVVTASYDGAAKIWDAASGDVLIALGGNANQSCAKFSPNGKRIVTGTTNGNVLIYDCEFCGSADDLLALARSRVKRQLTPEERRSFGLGAAR